MKIDVNLLEITKGQIDLDLKDIDNFQFERIENFRKFMENMVKSTVHINTISLAVHECRQRVKFDLICTPKKTLERTDLKIKLEILEIYASSVAHYRSLL